MWMKVLFNCLRVACTLLRIPPGGSKHINLSMLLKCTSTCFRANKTAFSERLGETRAFRLER